MTEMMRRLGETGGGIGSAPVTPKALADLVALVDGGTLNSTAAREVFAALFERGGDPAEVVRSRGLAQVSDAAQIELLADRVIAENPGPAADYRAGKKAALQFLVGRVMRESGGKANPQVVSGILRGRLDGQPAA
jgi:aspartyl-tRNA(Asn)/glutamyl-tRNA(Gln) amidotransferase subunit B